MTDKDRQAYWEHFPHQADIGIRGIGPSMEAAFEQAAVALTAVITDPGCVIPGQAVQVTCEAEDDPDSSGLLVDWLNALLYEMDVRGMLFSQFKVRIEANRLKAEARGEKIDISRHDPAVEVKGATFTALDVRKDTDGKWIAQCVVDV